MTSGSRSTASAHGQATLTSGGSPYELAMPPRVATWSVGLPTGTLPVGGSGCRWAPRYRSPLLRVAGPARGLGHNRSPPCRWPSSDRPTLQGAWLWPATLVEGLVVAGHPLSSPSLQK
ncbi:hypothetical protein B296_00028990 [Ensete ventricosum]|uniref:Uncharacterized protein n=1 Tax=Ensete ventricosum TaxID=4639 RepID=A0A426X375_ENSVE|nr:hypothetical protein B296_00028990 [Ensete ventricosum]